MAQDPILVTVSNTSAQVVGAGGYGFRVEPLANVNTGNTVDMDVSVRLDRQVSKVYRLRDDAPRYFNEAFEVMELVGGRAGDQWLVTVFETPRDRVGAPGRVLERPDVLAFKGAWADSEWVYSTSYLLPNANGGVLAVQPVGPGLQPPAFDVSRYTHVAVLAVCEVDGAAAGAAPALEVDVQFVAGAEAGAPYLGSLTVGATPAQAGALLLGPGLGTDNNPDELTVVAAPLRFPYFRVGYTFYDRGGVARAGTNKSYIRVVGMP